MTDELKQREQELEARALRINAGRKPKFGDLMRNPWAGESNPRRDAYFVRRVGDHYEFTDKRGDFWQTRAKFAFFIGATQPAPCTAEEVLRKKKQMVIDGDFLYDFDLERIRSAHAAIATQPAPIPVQAGEADLLAALKPFADAYVPLVKHDDPNEDPKLRAHLDRNTITPTVTIGDFRRAHEIYARATHAKANDGEKT